MSLEQPKTSYIDPASGSLTPSYAIIQRYLSELKSAFSDPAAVEAIMAQESDRLVYTVYTTEMPEERGQILHCTTVIHPGKVGDEYHMTRGHLHAIRNRAEICMGLTGSGKLILQNEAGDVIDIDMAPGQVVHIPPDWAHRLVNTSPEPFSFLSLWEGNAAHSLDIALENGFSRLYVERDGKPALVPNPAKTPP